jgi:hypothetical protein
MLDAVNVDKEMRQVPVDDLVIKVTLDDLIQGMGGRKPRERVLAACREIIPLGESLLHTRSLFQTLPVERIEGAEVGIGGQTFRSENLAALLQDAKKAIIYCLTVGQELEARVQELEEAGENMTAYLLDLYGSVAMSLLEERFYALQKEEHPGLGVTRHYAPGQNGWPISDQAGLFQLLGPGQIGVRLTDNHLLAPLKSVTGLFGIGDRSKVNDDFVPYA